MSQGAESQVRTMSQPACWRRPRLLRGKSMNTGRHFVTDRSSISDSAIWRWLKSVDWFKSQGSDHPVSPIQGATTLGPCRPTPDLLFTGCLETNNGYPPKTSGHLMTHSNSQSKVAQNTLTKTMLGDVAGVSALRPLSSQ
jgi:hypothetical protein